MAKVKQLIILAGGRGTRLKHETDYTPKPLVQLFDGKCILGLLIDKYMKEFSEILIFAGYKSEKIDSFINENYQNKNIHVLTEDVPSGTAGALKLHKDKLDSSFAVINGDTWFESDVSISSLDLGSSIAGLVLTKIKDASRYGSVKVSTSGKVEAFLEKGKQNNNKDNLINVGSYIFSNEIISYIKYIPSSLENDLFPELANDNLISGWITDGNFIDIGIPESLAYARANREFFNNEI